MLDLSTLYVMVSFASIIAGVVHVIPWATGRFGRWAAWWGFGHVLLGLTSSVALFRNAGAPYIIGWIGNPLAIFAYAAIFIGMRSFARPDARNRSLLIAAAVGTIPLLLSTDPAAVGSRVGYLCVVHALFDGATALAAWRVARRESLHTGWIVLALFLPTVPLFLYRAAYAFQGEVGTKLTGPQGGTAAWLVAVIISFVLFRGFALFALEAERGQQHLARLVERDALTGAYNRTAFDRLRKRWRGEGAVLVIDLDLFKQLNDRCGHAAGDAALGIATRVAQEVLAAGGSVFRWGGDEFVGVLPGADHAAAAAARACITRRFDAAVRAVAPDDLPISVSIGTACGPLAEIGRLTAEADAAMYVAKRARRGGDERQRSVAGTHHPHRLISQAQHG
ncbi:GGDEF domain-containing protein [Sphingomonas sp. VNH70]|uniref:GGDEF domain-containing protein n=1 Tax=Sphingomonas silueang TaxID=3156617 RepID=UPI0032B4E316